MHWQRALLRLRKPSRYVCRWLGTTTIPTNTHHHYTYQHHHHYTYQHTSQHTPHLPAVATNTPCHIIIAQCNTTRLACPQDIVTRTLYHTIIAQCNTTCYTCDRRTPTQCMAM